MSSFRWLLFRRRRAFRPILCPSRARSPLPHLLGYPSFPSHSPSPSGPRRRNTGLRHCLYRRQPQPPAASRQPSPHTYSNAALHSSTVRACFAAILLSPSTAALARPRAQSKLARPLLLTRRVTGLHRKERPPGTLTAFSGIAATPRSSPNLSCVSRAPFGVGNFFTFRRQYDRRRFRKRSPFRPLRCAPDASFLLFIFSH